MFYSFFSGPRFQNWEPRIRPLGGNFTDNPMFGSTIINSSVQRPKIEKIDPRKNLEKKGSKTKSYWILLDSLFNDPGVRVLRLSDCSFGQCSVRSKKTVSIHCFFQQIRQIRKKTRKPRIHKENEKVAPDYSASLHAGSAIRAGGAARCSGFDIVF